MLLFTSHSCCDWYTKTSTGEQSNCEENNNKKNTLTLPFKWRIIKSSSSDIILSHETVGEGWGGSPKSNFALDCFVYDMISRNSFWFVVLTLILASLLPCLFSKVISWRKEASLLLPSSLAFWCRKGFHCIWNCWDYSSCVCAIMCAVGASGTWCPGEDGCRTWVEIFQVTKPHSSETYIRKYAANQFVELWASELPWIQGLVHEKLWTFL